ncbi:DUF4230 domain-containing protein [Dysgonomonas sp. 25]|uniref:DUF4230 domain-containing protein n=1 Tax=Dysgonomonas sp. 25 TaxID=2302933 RepID=UPI0013D66D8B|nr:DUF4230 domain-containing protein [Dysgonomonas sp. 25]NDV70416.1 DUF4230 domain-containing protein [Dysgonomonas sp. 25]
MKNRNIIFLVFGLLAGILAMYMIMSFSSDRAGTETSHNAIVENIERLGTLEVVRYNIKDIVEYKKIRQWLPNAKTAMIVSGEVTVAIDLTQLKPQDIKTGGDYINLRLPCPVIHHVSINHSDSKIYNMEYGLWESEQIADDAYRKAEQYLREQAQKLDYQNAAYENTVTLLTPLLRSMGYNHITIAFMPPSQILP